MRTGLWNKAALDAVMDFIAQNDTPDTVYHLHNWAHFLSPAIFKALRPVEDRLVLTTHDYFLACGNGGQYDFQKNEVCTRVGNSLPCLTTQCDRQSAAHKAWRVARHAVRDAHFAGFCNREQLADLAAEARCVIVPSRLAEPFGLVAGEALWSGLPVLISGVAFLSGDIVDAGAGLTFDPLKIDTVVAALAEIRDNTPRVEQMSRAAFSNTATLANTLDSWLDAYDALYRSVQPGPTPLEIVS